MRPAASTAPDGFAPAPRAEVTAERQDGTTRITFRGDLLIVELERLRRDLPQIPEDGAIVADLQRVGTMDTAGAWLVATLAPPDRIEVTGASEVQQKLLQTVRESLPKEVTPPSRPHPVAGWLQTVGETAAGGVLGFVQVMGFFGLTLVRLAQTAIRPRRLRLAPLVHHMQQVGFDAIPIVSLMAFLIGVVLAFQGATQLQQFGAEVFVVDLIAISVLRELGVLLTAIIVAGRSGAAFTAAIGSMKMREEIDAMRTLSLDPIQMLVVPRVLALTLMLPILAFVADMVGLIGGALMSWVELGVSPATFQARLGEIDTWHYAVGLIKAPFFAVIIGIVGCYQGFAVEGNAESLGRLTSKSVVISIFTVIVADAVFSIFFALVGI